MVRLMRISWRSSPENCFLGRQILWRWKKCLTIVETIKYFAVYLISWESLHSSDQSQLPELPTPDEGHWRKPHKVNTIPTTLQLCHQTQAKKTNAKVDGLSRQTWEKRSAEEGRGGGGGGVSGILDQRLFRQRFPDRFQNDLRQANSVN